MIKMISLAMLEASATLCLQWNHFIDRLVVFIMVESLKMYSKQEITAENIISGVA